MRNYSPLVMVCTLALGAVVFQIKRGSIPTDYAITTALAVGGYVLLVVLSNWLERGEKA